MVTRATNPNSAAARTQGPSEVAVLPPSLARWDLYRLLSDPTRLRLLALASIEELAVSELAELLHEGQPKVSRQVGRLREAGLLSGRKHGTWLLLRLAPKVDDDSVVADAIWAGMELCTTDGTAARVADVVADRDSATRSFFARGGRTHRAGPPAELAAYLSLLSPLIRPRHLAVDAGTGDGALLEVLAPLFDHVIALDRSTAQLDLARKRAARRRLRNLRFLCGEIDGPEIRKAISSFRMGKETGHRPARRHGSAPSKQRGKAQGLTGADAVFAARVLHHAPVPSRFMAALGQLARPPAGEEPGGAIFVLDYETHRDEALREQQADLWLGFDPKELKTMAQDAGLGDITQGRFPRAWCGDEPDSHISWQWLSARRTTLG
jgi:DNA-binding transcriptional ArsR family regulator